MGKRSSSSTRYSQRKKNAGIRYKGNPSTPNHHRRRENRKREFDALREELSNTFGVPKDCRIYFLKKHPEDNLPSTPRIKIRFGTSVLLDADTWEVLQVNQFTPFSDMTEDKKDEMNYAVKTIYQHTLARGDVKINKSMKGLKNCGEMRSAGFRGGSDKGRTFGVTAVGQKTARSESLLLEDQARMNHDMAAVNEILAESMASLCMRAFQSNQDLALKYSIPSFSDSKWTESPNANVFASSVVCTRDGFYNNPHHDGDISPYTYALFTKINQDSGDFHCVGSSEYLGDIEGCCFCLDQYHVELSLDSCDGLVESIWASNQVHHTSRSVTYNEGWESIPPSSSPITRFGASLQISKQLLNQIEGLLKLKEKKTNQEWQDYKKKVVKCYEQEFNGKMSKCLDPKELHNKKKQRK